MKDIWSEIKKRVPSVDMIDGELFSNQNKKKFLLMKFWNIRFNKNKHFKRKNSFIYILCYLKN